MKTKFKCILIIIYAICLAKDATAQDTLKIERFLWQIGDATLSESGGTYIDSIFHYAIKKNGYDSIHVFIKENINKKQSYTLAAKRAQNISAYLITLGFSSEKISYDGKTEFVEQLPQNWTIKEYIRIYLICF